MKKIILIHDRATDLQFLVSGLEDKGFAVRLVNNKSNKSDFLHWIKGSLTALYKVDKNDVIICWFDFQAILCYWLAKLTLQRRKIICINVMLKNKPSLKNRIVSYLYSRALMDSNFKASITSEDYGNVLNKKLGINCQYQIIRDVFHETYCHATNDIDYGQTVFCGGRNGRDWNMIFEIANKMEKVTFNFVIPYKIYNQYKGQITTNINAYYDVSFEKFEDLMSNSAFVCLPLDTEAPSGLIVMFQAAGQRKMVITSNTCTTRGYIDEQKGVLLDKDVKAYMNTINYYLNNQQLANNKADNLLAFMRSSCSEELFVEGVTSLINAFEYENN